MRAWVMESGSCMFGDHDIVEVFVGTEAEAEARARQINTERKTSDAVEPTHCPMTFGPGRRVV